MLNRLTRIIQSIVQPAATLPDGPVFKSRAEHRLIQYRLTVQRMPRRVEGLFDIPTDDDLEPIEPGAFHTETDLFDVPGGDDDADWLENAWLAQQQGEA